MPFTLAWLTPQTFFSRMDRFIPWLGGIFFILLIGGLYTGLWWAPADYQQGDSYRIMFIHVPSAWLSMLTYMIMAGCSALVLVFRHPLAEYVARACAPLGAWFTLLALMTGAIWGKPMWGAWWVWDARLTSELILLFLYLGVVALQSAIEDRQKSAQAGAILALVGVVNIPIIHYSVVWWNTLHQGATVSKLAKPAIHPTMLVPLLLMASAFTLYMVIAILLRARNEYLTVCLETTDSNQD